MPPPGYVGYDSGGQLTEAVRRKPYTVVLLDEVEKAHPRVLTVLLQVLDEGRLTDGQGRTIDFTNAIIILTSNIGALDLLEISRKDQSKEKVYERVMAQVKAHFSPEFLNRLSAIVMFNSLEKEQLEKICQKAMKTIETRLEAQGIKVILEQSGVQAILKESYNRNYGARPVERFLEKNIVTKLSKMLISGELSSGFTAFIAGRENGTKKTELIYRIKKSKEGAETENGNKRKKIKL